MAKRLCSESANKTLEQCWIKLKNLKFPLRYVKSRVSNLDSLDLEDEKVVKNCKQNILEKGDETISYNRTKSMTPIIIEDDPISSKPSSVNDNNNGTDNVDKDPRNRNVTVIA
ncbi:unnamed protein product [Lepeophtheirus salmonis]|uniref:(salmon louse) hypothetical protein n=1 Tax=Lepeophtheirus salmonis TaxID=72036 RepID=A0A7R8HC34_LEPSM|nr:unnamed protein product [Lepeophtheirus salmonis]CAF2994460.1 unnamed protein product [Lepeophtheirus salmonis]